MKTRLYIFIIPILLLSFFSCTKEMSNEHGFVPAKASFYATVAGTLWNADSLQLVLVNNGVFSINGLSKTGEQISMLLPTFKTGTYILNASSDSYSYYANVLEIPVFGYYTSLGTASGIVTVSSIDTINHLISGSFTFNMVGEDYTSSIKITGGVFENLPYIGNPVIVNPDPNGTDTLKATIGGTGTFYTEQAAAQTLNGQLVITGVSADGQQSMSVTMTDNITPGNYTLDFLSGVYGIAYFDFPASPNPLLSISGGTLTIISNDVTTKRIKGTFSFTATSLSDPRSVEITNGYFSVNY